MLESSFLQLPGIGENTERSLWNQGIRHWNDLREAAPDIFGNKKAQKCLLALEESRVALEAGEFSFFQQRLGNAHAWRMIPFCEKSIAYLDIETTGLGFPPVSQSTSIAVSFRGELFLEHDQTKKKNLLKKLHDEVQMWVTFNGLCFDLPFLRRETGLEFSHAHVDLRVWFNRLGLRGGLKKIQTQFSEIPSRDSMDIDGFDAVRLWRLHEQGVTGALETLLTYNAEDTVVLETLLALAWNLQLKAFSDLGHVALEKRQLTKLPQIPTQINHDVYRRLRGRES
jgi:uncharacterized protein